MSSPLFRISMPTGLTQKSAAPDPWAGYQFWVWPYGWRKTQANVTVATPRHRIDPPAPATSAPAPHAPPAPTPPPSAPATPTSPERPVENGAGHLFEPPIPPPMGAGETPAQEVRANHGSLVWKIPSRGKGGHD